MSFPQRVVDQLLFRSARCCCLCHRYVGRHIEIHHIVPQAQGGADDFDNGMPLCYECHGKVDAYNREHPKGRKYQPTELKRHRDDWFAMVSERRVMVVEGHVTPVPTISGPTGVEVLQRQECADYLRTAMGLYIRRMQTRLDEASFRPDEPYQGLFHFEMSDESAFFGRQDATRQLLAHIRGQGKRHRLTVLHGESGVGKTSMIHAGIVPALLRSGDVPLPVRASTALDVAVRKPILDAAPLDERLPEKVNALPLHEFLRLACSGLIGQNLVILLDQFEDFFIRQGPEVRALFVVQLAACYDDEALPVRFVLSLRKGFLGDLDELRAAIPYILDNRFQLGPLTRVQAVDAITKPLAPLGITYEPALVDRVLDDLEREGIQPPQLQIVCQALFNYAQNAERTTIIEADYQAVGGTEGILRNYLDKQLRHHFFGEDRTLARRVLEELITPERTCKPEALPDLARVLGADRAPLQVIIDKLVKIRLLRVAESEGQAEKTYELAHECLAGVLEFSEEAQARKAAQGLIARGLEDWTKHRLAIPLDRLEMITSQREGLRLDAAARELLFRSALRSGYQVGYWLSHLPDRRRASQIACDENQAHPALWDLRTDLAPDLRIRVGLSAMRQRLGTPLLVLASLMLVVLPLLGVFIAGLRSQIEVEGGKASSLDAIVPRVDITEILPDGWQHISTSYLDTDADGLREWVVQYRCDVLGKTRQRAAPIGVAVYKLGDNIPHSIVFHDLRPPSGDYLCECECAIAMENVLSGLEGDELVIRDRCDEETTRLTIFHWDADRKEYVSSGLFCGGRIEISQNQVTVEERQPGRAQFAKIETYYPDQNMTYNQQDGRCRPLRCAEEGIVVSPGEPEDVRLSPYPEEVLVAFYNHYNDDEITTAYFLEEVRGHLGKCDTGQCGCIAPRHQIARVRVTSLQVESESELQGSDRAVVGATVVCEHRDGTIEGERYIRWHLVRRDDRWWLERPE